MSEPRDAREQDWRLTACPLCGCALVISHRADGSETAARCSACRWEASPGRFDFDDPWQRSSPETVSCRYCHADDDGTRRHAPGCPWESRRLG